MLIYVNGCLLPEEEAKISVFDRGFLYGDGVFETLRTYRGRIFKLEAHLDRLFRSAAAIYLRPPITKEKLKEATFDMLRANHFSQDVMLRITLSRGSGGGGIFPQEKLTPTVVIAARPLPQYPPKTFTSGWSVIIAQTRRNSIRSLDPRIKSLNFLNNILARAEATQAGAQEALMLNNKGRVAEGTISNFFCLFQGRLITPSAREGILPGITRQVVLDLAKDAGINVEEDSLALPEVYQSDEAFLTLTSAGIIPVVKIDSHLIGQGKPGKVTQRLRGVFEEYVSNLTV